MENHKLVLIEEMLTSVLHEVGKVNKRLDSMESRLREFENILYQSPNQASTPGFPQFRRLPTELRLRIWDLAIPRRKLLHYWFDESHSSNTPLEADNLPPIYRLAPPIVAQVCRESRTVARTSGRMYQLSRYFYNCDAAVGFWTWFDAKHDILELGTPASIGDVDPSVSASGLLAQARHVLVHVKDISSWVDRFLECAKALQNIYIQKTITEKVVQDAWDPTVVSELFGPDSVVMVNVNEPEELKFALQILKRNPNGASIPFITAYGLGELEACLKELPGSESARRMKRFSKEWAMKVFRKAWCSKGELAEGECSFDVCEIDLKNTRDMARMPRIRFVYTWEFHKGDPPLSMGSFLHPPLHEYHLIKALRPGHPRDLGLESEEDLPGGSEW